MSNELKVSVESIAQWFGSKSNMAKALGVTRSAITQWVEDGGLPAYRAIEIEKLSGGRFKAVDIQIGQDNKTTS